MNSSNQKRRKMDSFNEEIEVLIRARYPLLYMITYEEERVDGLLMNISKNQNKCIYSWSITSGLKKIGEHKNQNSPKTTDPLDVLEAINKIDEAALFVLKDYHPYLKDPVIIRRLRELVHEIKVNYKTIIIVSPVLNIPSELEKDITVIDYPLPTFRELYDLAKNIARIVAKQHRAKVELTKTQAETLVKASMGLTLNEAENAFAKAIVRNNKMSFEDLSVVLAEKKQIIRKSRYLEYYDVDPSVLNIGGLTNLKTWLINRGKAFGDHARRFGLPQPKGLLLVGVQGCGKSLTAKAVSAMWNLPLLRLDFGAIFSGFVGSSEENIRKAIKTAESIAPVVLWLDELEKGLAGSKSSGISDGGTSARVFATFLTWLQEKTKPVFVVATANDVSALPPEMLRKGRFDEMFFVDLPKLDERVEIFKIHIEKINRNSLSFDLYSLAFAAEGFSGAEIEQAIVSSLYEAFEKQEEINTELIIKEVKRTVPMSKIMNNEIQSLRKWAESRTRKAS